MQETIKIGVLGVGHLGRIHLNLIKDHPAFEPAGFFDTDPETARKVHEETGIPSYDTPEALIEACEAVDIVTPTSTHYFYASQAIKSGRHVFIEKPITETAEQAKELVSLAEEAGVKAQVGHVERFNPAFMEACKFSLVPRFIEAHRLAAFNPRGTDVSVIMDLMIHDIDLVFHLIKAPVKRVSASGVAVISDTPDISNARITFDNGAVANLTASRISLKKMRKLRLFQKNAYISIDLLKKELEVFKLSEVSKDSDPSRIITAPDGEKGKEINFHNPSIKEINSIQEELSEFARSIQENKPVAVSFDEAYQALKTARLIQEQIEVNQLG